MTEKEWNYAGGPGTGVPCGASHIANSKVCQLSAEERTKIEGELTKKGFSKAAIKKMDDSEVSAANKSGKSPEKSGGSTATGVGTAHELSMLKELGVKLSDSESKSLDENLERSGDKKDVVQKLAKENAKDLKSQLEKEGYTIDEVVWTAQLRGDGLAKAAGIEGLNERNNQSDILFKVTNKDGEKETLGVSLKAATGSTTYPRDIPFFNGGLGTESRRFGLQGLDEETNKMAADARSKLGITSKGQSAQKAAIKGDASLKKQADAEGAKITQLVRDRMINQMQTMDQNELRGLLSTMTGAPTGAGAALKTYKLTGYAKGSQSTKIEDAVDGRVPRALREAARFTIVPTGNSSIRIEADGVPLMKVRAKYASQALASSIKFSGEAP